MKLSHVRKALGLLDAVSTGLCARVAVRLFYSPRRFRSDAADLETLSRGVTTDVPTSQGPLKLTRWGDGERPLVLLVHGWEGRRSHLAPFVAPLVETGFDVAAFDGPAHGESPGTRTTLPRFAAAVREVHATIGDVHAVIAHSFGAGASAIAIRDGMAVERAVLISTPYSVVNVVERFASFLGLRPVVTGRMHDLMERLHGCPRERLCFSTIGPALNLPLLLIHDRADLYVPYQDGRKVHETCPASEFIDTEGLGHRRILRDDDVISRSVRFVSGGAAAQRQGESESDEYRCTG